MGLYLGELVDDVWIGCARMLRSHGHSLGDFTYSSSEGTLLNLFSVDLELDPELELANTQSEICL